MIIIISIMISGVLSVSTNLANNAKVRITNERIKEIYKALGRYLVVNGKLPCPASIIAIKSGDANYGLPLGAEGSCTTAGDCSASGVCNPAVGATNLVYGMVPIQALNLSNDFAEDGFEDKIAYIVDKRFTKDTVVPDVGTDSFGTSPFTSTITINEIPTTGVTQTNTDDAIFALVSYGGNKSGSFGINSSTQFTRSSDATETENDLDSLSSPNFNNILNISADSSDVFDDIVFYKTRNAIVSDFNAFVAIPCSGSGNGLSLNYGGVNTYYWPQAHYDQVVAADTQCPADYLIRTNYPTRRCGAFGTWETGIIAPCANI